MRRDAGNNCAHVIVGPSESDPEVAKTALDQAKVLRPFESCLQSAPRKREINADEVKIQS